MIDKTPFSENMISVSEVNATIKACMDAPIFKGLQVFGEVSGYKLSGPHAYFTLKDKLSQISCVCFYAAKTYMPKDGESVIVNGGLDYYVKGGRLSLQASSITPVGQGLLFLEFERLKAKLLAEGLFDEAHKIAVPAYSQNVCVITSKTGAVIRDIVTTIRRKNPIINITVKDVRVQGEGAARDIALALAHIDNLLFDVVILARGGGSLEDLAPFYDEGLVRAIYKMKTPIVSAIGHETDFSLADFVADARAATPTAAAELVAYDYFALKNAVIDNAEKLLAQTKKLYERKTMRSRLAAQRLSSEVAKFYVERLHKLQSLSVRLSGGATKKVENAERRVERACDALDNLSPVKTLKRGYFSVNLNGKAVTSVRHLKLGEEINAIGGDGQVKAKITEIKINEDK
ncbi:MAG: exodeoxyribonuclease VII large subunit [Clostridia bacterium]